MKVRVTASITTNKYGGYRVVLSNGVYSDYPTLYDAQRYANYKNNEDADDPEYMEVKNDRVVTEQTYQPTSEEVYERKRKECEEREAKKQKEEENNRKSKKTDDKYVFVISCLLRGEKVVVYLQSATDLTKIGEKYGGGFITTKCAKAKVFQTKASAQKHIDKLKGCWIVNHLFRSMKVVRKPKTEFEGV